MMHADRITVNRELARLRQIVKKEKGAVVPAVRIEKLDRFAQSCVDRKDKRKKAVPFLNFPDTLPITARKDDIIGAIKDHQVVIVSGETGSGKTTQIPKFCLAAGRGIDGKIGCTQPRRIAATTVSRRIAQEMGENLGESVGYKIRFQDKTGHRSFIKIMTDGILLAETQGDPWLNAYDTIIVDEAHERSLNIDFVLGILKTLVAKRKNLKLIITSATIDTEKFSKAFNDAPVIEVTGRTFPVETRYAFKETPDDNDKDLTHVEHAVKAVEQIQHQNRFGDILVFMPTENDIRETCDIIYGKKFQNTQVLPLFSRLSAKEQQRVFARNGMRKVIVATNVAETSITIPGIKYVVDTGLARISQYVPRSRTTALPVVPVSRSSADQRKGRCGRVENGICVRLFSEADYLSRPLFNQPEILRSNLAEVILRMIALKLGDVDAFPFIDRPAEKSVKDGFNLLQELGAIRKKKKGAKKPQSITGSYMLTGTGRIMARLPIDPRLSRMLIEGTRQGCLDRMIILAAVLSLQDPRERPIEKEAQADQAHAVFKDPISDFIALLNIWDRFHDRLAAVNSMNQMKKFCKKHFISFKRMREWRDIHMQISAILKEHRVLVSGRSVSGPAKKPNGTPGPQKGNKKKEAFHPLYTAIHKSILSGFLSNIAEKKEKQFFKAAKDRDVMIFPGSGLFKDPGEWIVAAEIVETSRIFARKVARIDPGWLESIGKEQCKSTFSDPHWERDRGAVTASEQVTLYGLVIVKKRPVAYGRINPDEASEIFIRSALVDQDVRQPLPFMVHNKKLVDEIRDLENRVRRRDILIDDEDLVLFYKKRLPGICDMRSLKQVIKKNREDRFLRMNREKLVVYKPDPNELELYPEKLDLGNRVFDCSYAFEPGADKDGVTVAIPSDAVGAVKKEKLDWVVPGLLKEKVTGLVKGLPKPYRKKLVPVSTTVEIILKEMPASGQDLASALSRFVFKRFSVDIPATVWPRDRLPDHLKLRLSIRNAKGKEIWSGRDRTILDRKAPKPDRSKAFSALKKKWEIHGIKQWDFQDLPPVLHMEGNHGDQWTVYPGLKADDDGITLTLFTDRKHAEKAHVKGVRTLLFLHFADDIKFLKKNLTFFHPDIKEKTRYFGGITSVEKQMLDSVITAAFEKNIRTKDAYESHAEYLAQKKVHTMGQEKVKRVIMIIEAFHHARTQIFGLEQKFRSSAIILGFLQSLREDLDRLIPRHFIGLYDDDRLIHLTRYIKAITIRAQRGVSDVEKDRVKSDQVAPFTEKLKRLLGELSEHTSTEKRAAVEAYFWMIEEFKISLFAQEIKTAFPISAKRLEKKLSEINRMI